MVIFNSNKESHSPLENKQLDWNMLSAMRIVYEMKEWWDSLDERQKEEAMGEEWTDIWDDNPFVIMVDFCEDLAKHFSKLTGDKIDWKDALVITQDFFERTEAPLDSEITRKNRPIVKLIQRATAHEQRIAWAQGHAEGLEDMRIECGND